MSDIKTENMWLMKGDCLERMKEIPDNSVDSVITDPPYGLSFMGKKWDYDVPSAEKWAECLRVLKPGGHLLAFSGTRTQHRMAVNIEDAGFEIRDMIAWVYGCLDEQTEVATINGVMPYHKTKAGDLVLCYDATQQTYSYQPILEIVEYEYSDTAYRLIGDFGEQVVSRNHRCIVERGGIEVFEYAEALQREARVPFLEDLPALQLALHDAHERAGCAKQGVQQSVRGGDDRGEEYGRGDAGIPQGANGGLRGMREDGMETGSVAAQGDDANMQPQMQWGATRSGMGDTCAQGPGGMVGGIGSGTRGAHDWTEQSGVEWWSNVSQQEGSVCKSANQVRALPAGVPSDGAQGWVCDGAQAAGGASCWSCADANRSGTPCEPQCDGQQAAKPDAVRNELRAQGVRAWGGHKTAMVRVVPFHYTGKVWCLRVPTGAFVAVRNGVAFPTGNSGFPKSLDVSKAIDKAAGVERERYERPAFGGMFSDDNGTTYGTALSNTPTTEAAFQWQGWGTALKPALEPITVARKPFECTVAENVLTHGVGAMNIDVCRVGNSGSRTNSSQPRAERNGFVKGFVGGTTTKVHDQGRWPANLIHDGSEDVLAAFPDAKGQQGKSNDSQRTQVNCYGATSDTGKEYTPRIESDKSAARFFYCAKSSKKDRGEGNNHPTVKPFDLMAYLCRLVTPPNGVILDPFMGSGSTGKAAVTEGFRFIGIEMDDKYFEIAKNRIMSA